MPLRHDGLCFLHCLSKVGQPRKLRSDKINAEQDHHRFLQRPNSLPLRNP